jgi:aldose 1-epimerase
MRSILLRDDDWVVRVVPLRGGLSSCIFRGQAILCPVAQTACASASAAELCYFPLVPFANRIKDSRFTFDGREIVLHPNLAGHPHAIHGHGWQTEWQVVSADRTACTLAFEHTAAQTWPWSYRVSQRFAIAGNVLTIELAVENLSADRMPAGLGFHPFLPRPESARLRATAQRVWLGTALDFPSRCAGIAPALDVGRAESVGDMRALDHCYSGWNGSATIEWADAGAHARVEIAATAPLEHLMVYLPVSRDFFCVEPVSHALNAFNFPESEEHAALALEPGARRAAAIEVRCAAACRTSKGGGAD